MGYAVFGRQPQDCCRIVEVLDAAIPDGTIGKVSAKWPKLVVIDSEVRVVDSQAGSIVQSLDEHAQFARQVWHGDRKTPVEELIALRRMRVLKHRSEHVRVPDEHAAVHLERDARILAFKLWARHEHKVAVLEPGIAFLVVRCLHLES